MRYDGLEINLWEGESRNEMHYKRAEHALHWVIDRPHHHPKTALIGPRGAPGGPYESPALDR